MRPTDRLHLGHLPLVFDHGAVELLLLGPQLLLQHAVLLVPLVHAGVPAAAAARHHLPPPHHLAQLVDGLRAVGWRRIQRGRGGRGGGNVSESFFSLLSFFLFLSPEFNASLQPDVVLNNG